MQIRSLLASLRERPLHRLERRDLRVDGCQLRVHERWDLDAIEAATPTLPTFVLLHGIGMSSTFFVPLAERLAVHGRVLLFDLPGFAGVPAPPQPQSIEDFADVVTGALALLDVPGRTVVVGHSMGAQVAAELLVRGVAREGMLIGPVVNAAERSQRQVLLRFLQSAIRESVVNAAVAVSGYVRCGPRWANEIFPELLAYPIEKRLAGLTATVLFVRGQYDALSPAAWVQRLAAQVSHADVLTLGGAAHGLVFDHSDRLADALLQLTGLTSDA